MLFLFCFAFCYFSLLSNICKQQSKYEIRRSILLGPGELFYLGVQCIQERNVTRWRCEFCSRWTVLLCTASGVLFLSTIRSITEAGTGGVLYKKVFLKLLQDSQENTCVSVSACNFIIKETLAQVFSYEFCKILKNIFFTEHHLATACAISF